jgi:hypothetical protein
MSHLVSLDYRLVVALITRLIPVRPCFPQARLRAFAEGRDRLVVQRWRMKLTRPSYGCVSRR